MTDELEAISLPVKWRDHKSWIEWALMVRHDWVVEHAKATEKAFHKYHIEKKSKRESELEWEFAWRAWVRKQKTEFLRVKIKKTGHWWQSASGIEKKAQELQVEKDDGELWPMFKLRVLNAAGDGPWKKT